MTITKEIKRIIIVFILGGLYALVNIFAFNSFVHVEFANTVKQASLVIIPIMVIPQIIKRD